MTGSVPFTRFHGRGLALDHPERAKRTSVLLTALVEHFGSQSATHHRVRDLSVGGIRIDNAAALTVGTTILISLGALRAVSGTVKWVGNGFAGVAFAQDIDLENARTKAIIAPLMPTGPAVFKVSPSPTAGWIDEIQNPYRR